MNIDRVLVKQGNWDEKELEEVGVLLAQKLEELDPSSPHEVRKIRNIQRALENIQFVLSNNLS